MLKNRLISSDVFKMDYDTIDELKFINCLKDEEFFENEFEQIKKFYLMGGCEDIHNFLKNSPGVMVILKNVKPLLGEYVPYAEFYLRLDINPIFIPQLLLVVNAHKHDFENGFKDDIMKINYSIRPLLSKLDLNCEFFIFDRMIHESN